MTYFTIIPHDILLMIYTYIAVRYCHICDKHYYSERRVKHDLFWLTSCEIYTDRYYCMECNICATPLALQRCVSTSSREASKENSRREACKAIPLLDLCTTFYPALEGHIWYIDQVYFWNQIVFPFCAQEDKGTYFTLCLVHNLLYSDYCRDCCGEQRTLKKFKKNKTPRIIN